MSEPIDPRVEFAARLRRLRLAAGLSVRELTVASARTPSRRPGAAPVRLARSTIDGMTSQRKPSRPERPNFEAFVDACLRVAAEAKLTLPEGLDTREAWDDAYERLRRQSEEFEYARAALRTTGRPQSSGPCPYRGLEAYGAADADLFFGRDAMTAELLARTGEGGLLVVTGPSGAGKSSLVRAGLIASLSRLHGIEPVLTRPGPEPVAALLRRLAQEGPTAPIIVDQFEELFTACPDEAKRVQFVDLLTTLEADGRPVIVVVRADFFGHCTRHPALVPALRRPLVVTPMNRDGLREAIEGPARTTGLTFQEGLVDLLMEDLSGGRADAEPAGVLPLLSHALRETWNHRQGATLTLAGYRRTGGIMRSLAQTADAAFDALDADEQRAARDLLTRLVRLGGDGPDTARKLPLEEATGAGRVLDHFVRARLVTVDADSVQFTHEALIRSWPRLHGWIEEDRTGLLAVQQLEVDARLWDQRQHGAAYLYRGERLARLANLRDAGQPISATAAGFLAAGLRSDRRARWTRRALVSLLVTLLVAASAAAVLAAAARNAIDAQRDTALSRQLSVQSALITNDPPLSALLAATSWRISPTDEARASLLNVLANPGRAVLTGHTGGSYAVAYSPDGAQLATGGEDGVIRWDARTGKRIGALMTGPTKAVGAVAYSPDGRTLVSTSEDGTVRLWDARSGGQLGAPLFTGEEHSSIPSVTFSPDGTRVAGGGFDGTIRLWDVRTREQIGRPFIGGLENVWSVAFNHDGTLLASGGQNGDLHLWDARTGRAARVLDLGEETTVLSVAFSPDGARLATGDTDAIVRLWDVRTGQKIDEMSGHSQMVRKVVFAHDGARLASTGDDGTIRLWDVRRGRRLGAPLIGHTGGAFDMAFSGDDGRLASVGRDSTVRLWDVRVGRMDGEPFTGHPHRVESVAFSPDGSRLASSDDGPDDAVRLWDVRTRGRIGAPLLEHTESLESEPFNHVISVAFGRRGSLLAGAELGGRIWVWDPRTGQRIGGPIRTPTRVVSLAMSPDDTQLASGGDDGTIRFWDLRTRRQTGALIAAHASEVSSLAYSRDGTRLVSGGYDSLVNVWNVRTGDRIGGPSAGHTGWVMSVDFAPDGTRIASGGRDGTVRLWDARTGRQTGTPLIGHTDSVEAVAFNPNGTTLVSGGMDATVRVWDARIGRLLGVPLVGGEMIWSLAFSPDGRRLAVGSEDYLIRVWDVALSPDAFTSVCAMLDREVTPAEWAQYVPGLPYEPVCRKR
uniref:NACHT and WD repeat domain-containing protein n=1 Tax=Herbidospora sakaeratensis TaxID=564415 RepID=UPI00078437E0|nr:hypothetical protein [Herbidospora sakaeratensis]